MECGVTFDPVYVGTAGWSLPRDRQHRFPGTGSHLERYAKVFPAVEINSTFDFIALIRKMVDTCILSMNIYCYYEKIRYNYER